MFECHYCGLKFKREKTLTVHLCEQKRRFLNKNEQYVRFGHIAYNKFYEITQGATSPKPYDHFAKSNYYTGFTRFGKYMIEVDAVEPEQFIDFVIRASIPLDKWATDSVYQAYINDLSRKESTDRAIERSILFMQDWAIEHDAAYSDFFRKITKSRAIHCIRSGRISPWVIFNCDSGSELVGSFDDQELKLVNEYLDPAFWAKKFSVRQEDVSFAQTVLEQAGL
jgi:hypothetical protein